MSIWCGTCELVDDDDGIAVANRIESKPGCSRDFVEVGHCNPDHIALEIRNPVDIALYVCDNNPPPDLALIHCEYIAD